MKGENVKVEIETDEEAVEGLKELYRLSQASKSGPIVFVQGHRTSFPDGDDGEKEFREQERKRAVLEKAAEQQGIPLFFVPYDEPSYRKFYLERVEAVILREVKRLAEVGGSFDDLEDRVSGRLLRDWAQFRAAELGLFERANG